MANWCYTALRICGHRDTLAEVVNLIASEGSFWLDAPTGRSAEDLERRPCAIHGFQPIRCADDVEHDGKPWRRNRDDGLVLDNFVPVPLRYYDRGRKYGATLRADVYFGSDRDKEDSRGQAFKPLRQFAAEGYLELDLRFSTKWSPDQYALQCLSRRFPDLLIAGTYEEGGNDVHGVFVIQGGETLAEIDPSVSFEYEEPEGDDLDDEERHHRRGTAFEAHMLVKLTETIAECMDERSVTGTPWPPALVRIADRQDEAIREAIAAARELVPEDMTGTEAGLVEGFRRLAAATRRASGFSWIDAVLLNAELVRSVYAGTEFGAPPVECSIVPERSIGILELCGQDTFESGALARYLGTTDARLMTGVPVVAQLIVHAADCYASERPTVAAGIDRILATLEIPASGQLTEPMMTMNSLGSDLSDILEGALIAAGAIKEAGSRVPESFDWDDDAVARGALMCVAAGSVTSLALAKRWGVPREVALSSGICGRAPGPFAAFCQAYGWDFTNEERESLERFDAIQALLRGHAMQEAMKRTNAMRAPGQARARKIHPVV